ncbi:hypothetical protein RN001_002003 [Aquatica leii]|uniref:PID domain-containing protein n=1 Tax=Aquatica leii TaxID=1421715 RepID=A0AAN7PGK3_9COLE|nr:hypothetical protein RN001_002003 [Aquatica leii]
MATQPSEPIIGINDLPMSFHVKYLGHELARGLWGIKHTRRPVDNLVTSAKNLPQNEILPLVTIEVSKEGLKMRPLTKKKQDKEQEIFFKVDTISYGVQDVIYTRVFCMIIVKEGDTKGIAPFHCHAFVCESRNQARQITYALAAAFQEYGRKVKDENKNNPDGIKKKFAIDLRSPEELEGALDDETEA